MSQPYLQLTPRYLDGICVPDLLTSITIFNILMSMLKLVSVASITGIASNGQLHTLPTSSRRCPTSLRTRVSIFSSGNRTAFYPMVSMSRNSQQCMNSKIYTSNRRKRFMISSEGISMVIMTLIHRILYTSLRLGDTSTATKELICS